MAYELSALGTTGVSGADGISAVKLTSAAGVYAAVVERISCSADGAEVLTVALVAAKPPLLVVAACFSPADDRAAGMVSGVGEYAAVVEIIASFSDGVDAKMASSAIGSLYWEELLPIASLSPLPERFRASRALEL